MKKSARVMAAAMAAVMMLPLLLPLLLHSSSFVLLLVLHR